jgi:diacylglycerol kinase
MFGRGSGKGTAVNSAAPLEGISRRRPLTMSRPWSAKFRDAFRGIARAVAGERSFWVHVPMTVAVALGAALLRVSLVEGCILGLCITLVLALEAVNTAIELLSREVAHDERPNIAAALDVASGAVLIGAIGAAAIGSAVFVHRLL